MEADLEPVEIAEYDPSWPVACERERGDITGALGGVAVSVEHVGSTAVPGLGAKPVIDIMVGVRSLDDVEECVGPLEALEYEYRGEVGIPGRLFFRRFTEGVRTHHLHMVEHGGEFWERTILFRDFLRENPQAAREYEELKVRLAAAFRTDREAYTEAKTEFIRSAEAKARAAS